ncbi:hypothetical protein AHAS_Ahas01G0166000 [Arachis hypogaea]
MMNRLKTITRSLRFLDSSLATRHIETRSLQLALNQVTHFSLNTTTAPSPSSLSNDHSCNHRFSSIHHRFFFSSKPSSILELVLTSDWSQWLELELDKCCLFLTHETVIYVLKNLDKNPIKASCFFNWVSEKQWFRPSSSVYSLVVSILAKKETREQFWITLVAMKKNGFFLDTETYLPILAAFKRDNLKSDCEGLAHFYKQMIRENARESVVNNVVGIITASEWGIEVMEKLGKLNIHLSDNFVARVVKEFRGCPLKAYRFFRWVGEQSGYEQNAVTYNAIARTLARANRINEFWEVIEEMKSVGYELDVDTYTKISRQLQKNRMIEDAVELYELMMDGSCKPSDQDCSSLLVHISDSHTPNLDLIFRIINKYELNRHTLPKAIYDGVHRSLAGAGKFDEAETIVGSMRNSGYEPDNVTFSQMVFGLCKMGRLEEACKVLEEMESCGCIPDIKTWTILIRGHCSANEIDKALLCSDKMFEKGCSPDAAVLGALVDCFLSQQRIEDAYNFLEETVRNFVTSPWQGTYKKLIEGLLGIEKLEEALDLMCLMRKHKYPPFIESIIRYISKSGTVDDAVKFLKAWSTESPQSHSAYVHVFESFFREGRESDARDLLSKCRRHITKRKEIRALFGSVRNCKAAVADKQAQAASAT